VSSSNIVVELGTDTAVEMKKNPERKINTPRINFLRSVEALWKKSELNVSMLRKVLWLHFLAAVDFDTSRVGRSTALPSIGKEWARHTNAGPLRSSVTAYASSGAA